MSWTNRQLVLALVLIPALSACQGQLEPIPEPKAEAVASPKSIPDTDAAVSAAPVVEPAFLADLVGAAPSAPV